MNSQQLYNNYIQLILSNIASNDLLNKENIKLVNEESCLSNILYGSKFIKLNHIFEIIHNVNTSNDINNTQTKDNDNIIYYIGLYQIQKLYFCLTIKKNHFNNFDRTDLIFKEIIQSNRITFFDNIEKYFNTYFNKNYYLQIEEQLKKISINSDHSINNLTKIKEIKDIDELNVEIIMRQTDLDFEMSSNLYKKMNKNIEKCLKIYYNIADKNKYNHDNEELSTNQLIYKQIREFLK